MGDGTIEEAEAPKAPDGAVDSFEDPKTKEVVWIIPRKGESKEDAIKRVKADHGMNPDLGEFQSLHPEVVNLHNALRDGDSRAAVSIMETLIGKLNTAPTEEEGVNNPPVSQPAPMEVPSVEQRVDPHLEAARHSAGAAREYINRSKRTSPTKPEIEKPGSYEGLFRA